MLAISWHLILFTFPTFPKTHDAELLNLEHDKCLSEICAFSALVDKAERKYFVLDLSVVLETSMPIMNPLRCPSFMIVVHVKKIFIFIRVYWKNPHLPNI